MQNKKYYMKRFSLFFVLLMACLVTMAVPSNRKPKMVKQSDGTTLSVVLKGDEALRFYTTMDGKYLIKEPNGDFSYATLSAEGELVSTNCIAHDKDERSSEEIELLSSINIENVKSNISKSHAKRSATYRSAAKRAGASIKPIGEVNVPVLLIEYKDVKFTYAKEDIDRLLNEEGYTFKPFGENSITTYGSARDYFIAQSEGKFKPRFIPTDIVTLPQNMAYYGANVDGADGRPGEMIRDAIKGADANVDFSKYDNNGDGEVEFVYCIYAGYSEANGANENTIWPHQWLVSQELGRSVTVDGVKCDVYACSSELNADEESEQYLGKVLSGIGTMCHEFSHCLGLYDIYDVSGDSGNWGMDEWDLMDNGNHVAYGYLPVGYNSYQKDVCGWKTLEVLTEKGSYSMKPQTQGGVGYKIVNDANPNEYFILENRKREGWDQELASDGMMIIHVDYDYSAWNNNEINVEVGHPRFQIVPADNDLLSYYNASDEDEFYENMAGDLWPGKVGNTEFTNTSLPAAKVYKGGYLNKPVTNIKYENDIVSFKFMSSFAAPILSPETNITNNSFVANWSVVDDAVEYDVELYRSVEVGEGAGNTVDVFTEDFMNCAKANLRIEDSIDEYMSSDGWEGYNVYSENGVVRLGSKNDSGYILTPYLNANGNVSVTLKTMLYNSNDTNVKLTVEIVNYDEELLATKTVVPTAGGLQVELNADVNGEFYVALGTDESTGSRRANIDDLKVSLLTTSKDELVTSVTTSDTSYEFKDLSTGTYKYRVRARSAEDETSPFTTYRIIAIGNDTSVESVTEGDGNAEIYSISGVKVGDAVNGVMPKLQRGIYIVKSNSGARKVFVK